MTDFFPFKTIWMILYKVKLAKPRKRANEDFMFEQNSFA